MRKQKCFDGVVIGLVLFGANACGGVPGTDSDTGVAAQDLYGMPSTSGGFAYWSANVGQGAVVPVCWSYNAVHTLGNDGKAVTGFPAIADLRAETRTDIEDSWGRWSYLLFTGWDTTCKHGASNTTDDQDRSLNPATVMFTLKSKTADNTRSMCDQFGKSTTRATIIRLGAVSTSVSAFAYQTMHEMGHALGFAHEQERPDNPGSTTMCKKYDTGETTMAGGTYFTPSPDNKSIMCYDNSVGVLSPGDIVGVQTRYGRKRSLTLIGKQGYAAYVSGQTTAAGSPIELELVDESGWDKYTRTAGDNLHEIADIPGGNGCLNVAGGTLNHNLITWPCTATSNEQFMLGDAQYGDAELRGLGNLCMTLGAFSTVQMATCTGTGTQSWMIQHATSSLRADQVVFMGNVLFGNGQIFCLTTQTTNGALGEALKLAACSATDTRQRFVTSHGMIMPANNTHWCANVIGGIPTPGSAVGLWDGCVANSQPLNEVFFQHGPVTTLGGCLDINGPVTPGTPVDAVLCNARDTQAWDFYF